MEITRITYELSTKDVNLYRKLRTSAIFQMMQDAAVKNSKLMNADYAEMMKKNLIWVVVLQKVDILRHPENGETITIESWPGRPMHTLMPRYYRFLDAEGETIINGSALWVLVDVDERRMINPEERDIILPYLVTGYETPRPRAPKGSTDIHAGEFTVPFSFLDLNGHMNNCRYFDISEDILPPALEGRRLKTVTAEYSSEIRLSETVSLNYGFKENKYLVTGDTDKNCFKIQFEYK